MARLRDRIPSRRSANTTMEAMGTLQKTEGGRAGPRRRTSECFARRNEVLRAAKVRQAGQSRRNAVALPRQKRSVCVCKAEYGAVDVDTGIEGKRSESSGTGKREEFVRSCVSRALEQLQGQLGSLMVLSLFVWMAMGNTDEANAATLQQQQDAISSGMNHPQEIFQIGADDSFWTNVVRYFQYFISLTVGLLYVNLKPLFGMMRKPGTAIVAILFLFGAFTFVKLTVSSMLGLDDPATME